LPTGVRTASTITVSRIYLTPIWILPIVQ
jgi:hypothetical protein